MADLESQLLQKHSDAMRHAHCGRLPWSKGLQTGKSFRALFILDSPSTFCFPNSHWTYHQVTREAQEEKNEKYKQKTSFCLILLFLIFPYPSSADRDNVMSENKTYRTGSIFFPPRFCLHLILDHGWIGPKIYRSRGWGRNRSRVSRATEQGTRASHWNSVFLSSYSCFVRVRNF